jgi:hypothetical protein
LPLPPSKEKKPDKPNNKPQNNEKSSPPSPSPKNPTDNNPDQEDNVKFVSTKIESNTFKYHFQRGGDKKITFLDFIACMKIKDQKFFSAFQGALKDANAKLSAYF